MRNSWIEVPNRKDLQRPQIIINDNLSVRYIEDYGLCLFYTVPKDENFKGNPHSDDRILPIELPDYEE